MQLYDCPLLLGLMVVGGKPPCTFCIDEVLNDTTLSVFNESLFAGFFMVIRVLAFVKFVLA